MNNIVKKFEYKYFFDRNNHLIINVIISFLEILDDNFLKLRIYSKKSYEDLNKEERDPLFIDSNVVFDIKKNYSNTIRSFSFVLRNFDDIESVKIGVVKEYSYWIDNNIYQVKLNYLQNKNSIKILLDSIYSKLLNRKCDESGFDTFYNLLLSKSISISEVYSVIKNSEEFLSKNKVITYNLPIEDIDVLIECPANRCDGYGNSAHYFCENLSLKSKIRVVPTIFTNDISENFNNLIIKKDDYKKYNPKNYLFFNIPNSSPSIAEKDIRKYIFTMFESTKIPSSWPAIINSQFDNLIVPSEFCKEIFKNNGVSIKTDVVTLGVNENIWPLFNRNLDKKTFKFLLFANAHWENTRKNYQLTLDSFTKAFGNHKNVELVVKLTQRTNKFDNFKYKNVKFIFEKYNHLQMLELVNSCDCLVFVSNGEGFGLPPREAMATGMPVILMNWSSLSAICKSDISYWIEPSSLQPAIYPPEVWPMNNGSKDFGEFAKGSVDDLADIMNHVYLNKEIAYQKGLNASKYIRENETYNIATSKFLELLK